MKKHDYFKCLVDGTVSTDRGMKKGICLGHNLIDWKPSLIERFIVWLKKL